MGARGVLRGVVAAVILAACPAAPPPSPPKPPPLEVRRYAPLAFKTDALDPRHAVLLGTDESGGSTLLPIPAVAATAKIDVVGRTGLVGIELASTPQPTHDAQLLTPNMTPQLRADVWSAVLAATGTLDKQPGDFQLSVLPSGPLDDVSCSAALATGLLATLTGSRVDPSATILGALMPDGSIGPTRNLAELVVVGAKAGKKRIGYPLDQRQTKNAAGMIVDIEALAKQNGAEAIALGTLHDAYRLVSGAELPRPRPVAASDMALDPATTALLDAKYKQWQQRLGVEWAALLQLESVGRVPSLLAFLRDYSKRSATSAEDMLKRGMHAAAYAHMFTASLAANAANQAYDILSKVQNNQIDAAIGVLAKYDKLAVTTGDVLAAIGTQPRTTLGSYIQAIAAFRPALRGWVFESYASKAIEAAKAKLKLLAGKSTAELGSDQTAETVISIAVPALLYVGKTVSETTLAREQLDLTASTEIPLALSAPALTRDAAMYTASSLARLDVVEATLVEPFAQRAKLTLDEARARWALSDHEYLVSFTLARLSSGNGSVRSLREGWGESSSSWALLAFAAAELANADAFEILVKSASLQVQIARDGSGRVEKVEHERALASLLVRAEAAARANARMALIATGAIPLQAKLAYEKAVVDSAGAVDDQFDALTQFWASSAYSQMSVKLARD